MQSFSFTVVSEWACDLWSIKLLHCINLTRIKTLHESEGLTKKDADGKVTADSVVRWGRIEEAVRQGEDKAAMARALILMRKHHIFRKNCT